MKNLLLLVAMACSFSLYSQQKLVSSNDNGRVIELGGFNKKYAKPIDFTDKLELLYSQLADENDYQRKDFWSEWESTSMPSVDLADDEQRIYFKKLKTYYDNLSPVVQDVFTVSDIWNIYSFNEELYRELPNY